MTAERGPGNGDQQPNKPAEEPQEPPHGGSGPQADDPSTGSEDPTSEDDGTIELEPLVESEPTKREGDPLEHPPKMAGELDVCPNCGAPLVGESTVVCMRCGFDLRTLKPVETRAEAGIADEQTEPAEPVAPTSELRVSVSWVIAGIAAATLLIGLLTGVQTLFPGIELKTVGEGEEAREIIPWTARWMGALKYLVTTIIWFACVTAGLAMFARLVERPFGAVRAGCAHLLATVTTMQLARFWGLGPRSIEWTLETATALLVFLGLSLALLNLSRRDVITYALITALVFLCLFFASHVITWAMG